MWAGVEFLLKVVRGNVVPGRWGWCLFALSCEPVSPFVALMSCVSFYPVKGHLERPVKKKCANSVNELFVGFGLPFTCDDIDGPLTV